MRYIAPASLLKSKFYVLEMLLLRENNQYDLWQR